VDWSHLAYSRDHWQDFMRIEMKLRDPYKVGNLTSCKEGLFTVEL